jgi:hypothetical protein
VKVVGCSVDSNPISVGDKVTLTVTIDEPAPESGQTVMIDNHFNGSEDTFDSVPNSIGIQEGLTSGALSLQTKEADPATTEATFTAYIGSSEEGQSITLKII